MMYWKCHIDPSHAAELVGMIPDFLSDYDDRPAAVQLDANYQHGGGWRPLKGWVFDPATSKIKYPGDPSVSPVAETMLRDERIIVYTDAWVAIVKADGTYEVARMD